MGIFVWPDRAVEEFVISVSGWEGWIGRFFLHFGAKTLSRTPEIKFAVGG